MAYSVMAYIVMAYTVMAYIIMASYSKELAIMPKSIYLWPI